MKLNQIYFKSLYIIFNIVVYNYFLALEKNLLNKMADGYLNVKNQPATTKKNQVTVLRKETK